MGYLGVPPQSGFITTDSQRVTSSTNNYVDLDNAISSLDDVIVYVNSVKQDITNLSLTTSTRITLGGTLTSSDVCEIIYLGKAVATQTPATGTVTNDMLAGSIANSKLANSSISINGSSVSLGGSLTGIGETNTPAFFAHRSSGAGVSSGSTTLIQPDNELYDTDSAYNTSDGKFTVPSGKAGKYFFHCGVYFAGISDGNIISCEIYVNNSAKALVREHTGSSGNISVQCTFSADLSVGDYVTYKVDQNSGGSLNTSGDTLTFLSGFRIA